jgi:hypothetical protein
MPGIEVVARGASSLQLSMPWNCNRTFVSCWPSSTEAATRPNKEHHNSLEFPFLYLALAIYAENDRNEGCTMFKGREKVPVWWIGEIRGEMKASDVHARMPFLAMR